MRDSVNKLNCVYEVDKVLEKHNLSKLIQLKIDSLNGPISINTIEFVIEFFPQKIPGPECFPGAVLSNT